METSKISRLRDEQQKAVSETEEKMGQLEKYKSDYTALQNRLETLPDKVTHDVMVPFGKLAFMPGKLVHTNEILVLLGDNWFAERSAKQACEIAGRRITELDKRIAELKEQKSLLEPRLGITSELQAVAEGRGDYKEIAEDYDEEKERLWDEQHKINIRRHHEKLRKSRNTCKPGDKEEKVASREGTTSDEDFWSRLDALEKQEEERGELNSSFDSDSDTERGKGLVEEINGQTKDPVDKKVNWIDEKQDKSDDDDDDDDDGAYDNDEDSDSDDKSKPIVKTIRFHHTKTPTSLAHRESASSQGDGSLNITSPGEIYKLFSPKPILKKTSDSTTVDRVVRFPDNPGIQSHLSPSDQAGQATGSSNLSKFTNTSNDKAFTGIVREHPSTQLPSAPSTTTNPSTSSQPPKRMSKFRAQRKGQNP